MKKLFAIVAVTAFFGASAIAAYSLADREDTRKAEKKSAKTECSTAVKAVAEKPADCGSATNAVLTSGSEKASDCGSATNAVLTSGSEKSSDCSAPCGSATAVQTAVAATDCSTEKAEDTKIAENK